MEKIKLSNDQIYKFARTGFETIGYKNLESINLYFLDNHTPSYSIYFSSTYHDQPVKILKVLNLKDFMTIINFGMILEGYGVEKIVPVIKEDSVSFACMVNISTYPSGPKYTKRRKK